ncbi:MAG: type VI secretion system baseplate subunit TssF [Chitinispirillaceae bacterium]
MIEKYYEEELRYLFESGREFAKAHPDRAHYLNIDSVGDRDPYVERLFEGFAFLVARIREKLDDSFPQITQGLTNLLWPQFLQQIPSCTIVQFEPRQGALQEARTLPQRSEITSGPVGPESAVCRFTTTRPLVLNPISLSSVTHHTDSTNREVLTFTFACDTEVQWAHYDLSKIRVFLHTELPTALMVHRALTTQSQKVEIGFSNGQQFQLKPKAAITPGGLAKEETLLPCAKNSFWGHNLLREYFVYPEKFLFVDFNGISSLPPPEETPESVTIRVTLNEPFPPETSLSTSIFKLNCCPATNIFKSSIEPILKTGLQSEYRVTADSSYIDSVYVHSMRSVAGLDRVSGHKTVYEPLYTFGNIGSRSKKTYATRFVHTPSGSRVMNIILGGPQLENRDVHEENIIMEAWCTNGNVPREYIREGGITSPGKGFPEYLRVTNITRPTLPFLPPSDKDLLWTFQAHLAASHKGIASGEVFRKYLHLYDWSGQEGRARRIESVKDVSSEPMDVIYKGSVIRGIRFTVALEEQAFKDVNDVHLFGSVLSCFLTHYVTLNSFCELRLVLKPSGKTLEWNQLEGRKCLI